MTHKQLTVLPLLQVDLYYLKTYFYRYALIHFKSFGLAKTAMKEMTQQLIDGNQIVIRYANSNKKTTDKDTATYLGWSQTSTPSNALIIRNISHYVTGDDLCQTFWEAKVIRVTPSGDIGEHRRLVLMIWIYLGCVNDWDIHGLC